MRENRKNLRLFLDQLRDAAIQLRFLRHWQSDRKFKNDGGRIIYAVDADVFTTYGNPSSTAETKGNRLGYGQVFSTDSRLFSTAITQRLADHIFFEISPTVPLMVMPPIDQEISSILRVLSSKFGVVPPTLHVEYSKLDKDIQLIGKTFSDHNSRGEIYTKILKVLYLESGPGAEYRKLARLLALDRLASPKVVADSFPENREIAKVLQPFIEIKSIIEHLTLSKAWFVSLNANLKISNSPKFNKNKKRKALQRDAEALARLEIWNRALEDHNIQIIYITGARHIFNVALTREVGKKGEKKLAEAFIRHPRYFLGDEDVLADLDRPELPRTSEQPHEFYSWLKTFLGQLNIGDELLDQKNPFELNVKAENIGTSAFEKRPQLAKELEKKWSLFTSQALDAYQPPQEVSSRILEELSSKANSNKIITSWMKLREELDKKILQLTTDAWNDCFYIATQTGFLVRESSGARDALVSRTMPPVYFDGWPETMHLIQEISGWHERKSFDKNTYEKAIQSANEDDNTGYAYYLMHAALFAARGEWSIAANVCDQAIAVVEEQRDYTTESDAHGREAYYLAAYCRRHSVRDASALDSLAEYLKKAKRILEKEREFRPNLDPVEERFDAEYLALELTKLLFIRYQSGNAPNISDEYDETAQQLLDTFQDIRKKLQLRKVKPTNSFLKDGIPYTSDRKRVFEQLHARICVNILTMMMIFFRNNIRHSEPFGSCLDYLEKYVNKNSTDDGGLRRSYYVQTILLCAKILFYPDTSDQKKVTNHFVHANNHFILPYDKKRYKELLELVRGNI